MTAERQIVDRNEATDCDGLCFHLGGTVPSVETHWEIVIIQRDGFTLVSCGCNWRDELEGVTAIEITRARTKWDNHNCKGRELRAR